MNQAILTLNAGSSSIKSSVYEIDGGVLKSTPLINGRISGLDQTPVLKISGRTDQALDKAQITDYECAFSVLLAAIEGDASDLELIGAGHRIVHGGADFREPVVLTKTNIARLEKLSPLAPGHQPHNLKGVEAAQKRWPGTVQIGCFDTSFHRTLPQPAMCFAIPEAMTQEGIVRYGFHGLSYEYIASAMSQLMDQAPHEKTIVAHLGAGASMCALQDGKSVATTMGFSALDGLPMGTRCGDIDPGVLLFLLQEKRMSTDDVAECLYNKSGLLGMSQISADMRKLEQSNDPRAGEAIDYFVYRAALEIGALTAALGGLDALVFTAGIGENAASIREKIVTASHWLGFEIDETANLANKLCITKTHARPSAWVIATNEEFMIAQHTLRLLAPS